MAPGDEPVDKTIGPEGERVCRKCRTFKTGDHFPLSRAGRYPVWECYECKRARDNAHYAKHRTGQERPKKAARTLDGITFWCPACTQYLPADQFSSQGARNNSIASTCTACRKAKRLARLQAKALEKPAPRPPGTGGFSLVTPKKGVPVGDPAAMLHPAEPCDAVEGYALAISLHNEGCFVPLVRGWFTSVGEVAEEVVQPRFETPGLARMWSEMILVRTGGRRASALG